MTRKSLYKLDGERVNRTEEWLHCPNCEDGEVRVQTSYEGQIEVWCKDCETYGSIGHIA